MIEKPDWQKALAEVITDPLELCELLELDPAHFIHQEAIKDFALRVPRDFVARMQKNNPHDPLLKQILPLAEEMQIVPGYTHDPLNEKLANPTAGLLHKYHSRVLLLIAGACAINCRYCFRRHFAYQENIPQTSSWDNALDYIAADKSISEVIYSGGEPLLAKDAALAALTQKIAAIPHVTLLRIHTRFPIVIPERITEELLDWLTNTRLSPVLVVHCNHPNEIDEKVMQALMRLRKAGVTVLNQAVLLRGVNDQAETLIALSKRLFSAGVLPYYLHILDAVQGTAHFSVSITQAKQLMGEVSRKLPGYLVPRLVQERFGVPAKYPLLPDIMEP